MGSALLRLRNRPFFLLAYFFDQLLIAAGVLAWQLRRVNLSAFFQAPFSFWGFYLLPLGLIVAVQIPVLMHNCVHGNLRPKILNSILGELAGVYILLGMEAFALNHLMHHAYADTDLDPHNPHQKTFVRFFFANNFGGTGPVLKKYLEFHGDTKRNRRLFRLILILHFANVPARLAFWLLLLGPSLMATLFIPSYLFHLFVFSHINFVTHTTGSDGKSEVFNLDSNLYYKFVNFFGSGVYFHKNHHLSPKLFNPQQRLG